MKDNEERKYVMENDRCYENDKIMWSEKYVINREWKYCMSWEMMGCKNMSRRTMENENMSWGMMGNKNMS